ncbi:MAG: response regulator [Microscillaceae bacterium]|nr:response regulator [Microscillaceae bacterium]
MKGHIGVDSELGQGSTFWFTFEAHLSREVAQNAQAEALHFSTEPQFSESVPSVLVVDDNAVNRKVASEILRKAGCEVRIAQSGAECLAMLSREKKHFDLILMDIQMPDMDGVETTRRLREKFGKALPPIVAMTAYSMREDREKFLAKGLDDYISKPIKAQALINKVKEHLLPVDAVPPVGTLKGTLAQPGGAMLDLGILRQLSKYGGVELVQESLREFCEDSEVLLQEAQGAFCLHQPEIIRQKIHTLKGNAGTLGVNQVARLATAMEKRLKEGNYPALADDLNLLAQHFADFKENYIILLAKI